MTPSATSASRNLLIISGTWPPLHCGVGDYTARLSEHLAALAIHVHVLTSKGARADFQMGGSSLVNVMPRIERWDRSLFSKVEACIREIKPDVLLIQWPTSRYGRSLAVNRLAGRLKKKFSDLPIVTTLHEYRYFHALGQWRARQMIKASDRIVFVDPMDVALVRESMRQREADFVHIPIGANIPRIAPGFDREAQRRTLGIAPGEFVYVFFGFINPPKGVDLLLEAYIRVLEKQAHSRLLIMARLDPGQKDHVRLIERIQQAGLAPRIINPTWAPPRETAEILAAADCAVLPFRDGASLKRGTLMACLEQGLPVITTAPMGRNDDFFARAEGLCLVPAGQTAPLADAMLACQSDSAKLAALAQGSRDLRSQIGWEPIAERHLELFADVMEEYA